jgi:TRAP-type mannitol/chloroaromatic compound transport system permease small subunit
MRFFSTLAILAEKACLRIGDAASWLLLAVAGAGVAMFLLRHLLGAGSVAMPPAYVWCSALVVMAGGGLALKAQSESILLFRFLSARSQGWTMILGAVFILLPWAFLLDLFAGSLSLSVPGLIGEVSGTLESLWWRLAVDVGALTLGLEGIGLLAAGGNLLAGNAKDGPA